MADAPAKPAAKKKKTFSAYTPGRMCPKCGKRMGEHKDRFSCGGCGYAEFKPRK